MIERTCHTSCDKTTTLCNLVQRATALDLPETGEKHIVFRPASLMPRSFTRFFFDIGAKRSFRTDVCDASVSLHSRRRTAHNRPL